MQYQGSKSKFAKNMLLAILSYRHDGQWWVEPFCGACSVTQHVVGNRIASDNNAYLIAMWKALQSGCIPPENISEDEYKHIKNNKDKYAPELVSFVGFGCSFGGKWFGGYARNKFGENYAKSAKNSLIRRIATLKDVLFFEGNYYELEIPPNSLIYCDPPYASTERYHCRFDHTQFWAWVRRMCRDGHLVFVSEYNTPSDFVSIWEYARSSHMSKKSYQKTYTENVFIWKGM